MDKTLILIDGSSFIFRAFHAMPNLTSPDNRPTGATYGMINMLKQMLKKYDTANWCCVFDAPGKTFRHEIYPLYKAHRSATPIELISQLKDIYSIIPAIGIPVIIEPGVEADDVIGTIATTAKQQGYYILIATGDKDFAQLVDDKVTLINTMNDETLDINGVIDKFGVAPNQIIDYLTLIGDSIDNVPGIDKCGPKTANKWLNQYGNLPNLIANADHITGIVGQNLRNSISWLTTAKKLITIQTNIDLAHAMPDGIASLTLKPANKAVLSDIYTELGFKTWLKQISEEIANKEPRKINTELKESLNNEEVVYINDYKELNYIVDSIISTNSMVYFYVLPSVSDATKIGYVLFSKNNKIYIVSNNYQLSNEGELFSINDSGDHYHNLFKTIIKLFESNLPKISINYKDTLSLCRKHNLTINNVRGDLTLAHYVLNSKVPHTIQYMCKELADIDILEVKSRQKNEVINSDLILDNITTLLKHSPLIYSLIESKLEPDESALYKNIELPLVNILVDIENVGIKIDIQKFKVIETELSKQLNLLENKIYYLSDCVFNINSPKQLQDVLFNRLKLSTNRIKKNTQGFSTNEDSLKNLSSQGIEIAAHLLEYRTLSKLLNTYVCKLPLLIDSSSKIHTTFDQTQVASGRLSSRDPNLQNIPIKSEWGHKIRQCFTADDDNHVLICADYSQIELRILAHFSQDENLIEAFNNNQDIHSITASEIFHKSFSAVTRDERRYAKTINFSLLYGKTIYGLALELNIDRATAKSYIDTYFNKYPKILSCLENIKSFARSHGYVKTLFGRKIYLPNINSNNKIVREAEERVALNSPMQGTSADIIKIAMCRIHKWFTENNLASKIILQVHDELIIHTPKHEIDIIKNNLSNLMTENFTELSVKLTTDIKIAHNWGEAH